MKEILCTLSHNCAGRLEIVRFDRINHVAKSLGMVDPALMWIQVIINVSTNLVVSSAISSFKCYEKVRNSISNYNVTYVEQGC